MQLSILLQTLDFVGVQGPTNRDVFSVTRDSRKASRGTIFVAIQGASVDGHDFVSQVESLVAIVEKKVQASPQMTIITVVDTKLAFAQVGAALHGFPSTRLPIVGVTGTNGKTTISTLVEQALSRLEWKVGRVGTTGASFLGQTSKAGLTTPEAPQLQAFFADVLAAGGQAGIMEVSSIGLSQRRVDAMCFHLAVFTNLGRDHLDFHGTLDGYREAKARLFRELLRPVGGSPRALLCADDPGWSSMDPPSDRWLYGFAEDADVRICKSEMNGAMMQLQLQTPGGTVELSSALIGAYNAQNLAAALGICALLGADWEDAASALGEVGVVRGRLEGVENDRDLFIYVDYAHTPDALAAALTALREVTAGKLWVVFGCGGNRDQGKRPEMGRVASALADSVVITSDNPRNEEPLQIIEDILSGVENDEAIVEVDRARAIGLALDLALAGDAVLIAGKGHETTQEIAGQCVAFDDRHVVQSLVGKP